MIIITHPGAIGKETYWINALLDAGLELLHIRKPDYPAAQLKRLLSQVHPCYYDRLVLHQHHELGQDLGIKRVHIPERMRSHIVFDKLEGMTLSTSVHHIKDFNRLPDDFSYAFLSPVFDSISKLGYGGSGSLWEQVAKREQKSIKLIALGGITPANIKQVLQHGFDDIALLGSIWNREANVLAAYKSCRQEQLNFKNHV